ncbi:MAG: TRAP transporter large permease subunit [Acetobacteraceae bacterium]
MAERLAELPGATSHPASRHIGSAWSWANRALAGLTEFSAALLVVVEIVTLLAAVIARYVFHSPIIWSDEFTGAVFLWLSMLGAVIALRRGEHMRFTALVQGLGPRWRTRLEILATLVVIALLLLLLSPAQDYVEDESFATLPNLGIPSSDRVVAIEGGIILMLLTLALQGVRRGTGAAIVAGIGVVAAVGGGLWLLTPGLMAIGNFNLLVFFVGLVGVTIAIGVPIGFAFGISTIAYLALTTTVPLSVVLNRLDQGMSQPILLAVPMFVFLGLLIELTGLARSMVAFLVSILGGVRGGLYYVLLGAMLLVSGISGSKAADMAAVAPALFPEMRRRGVEPGDLVALLASSAAMADTIPPSLVLITLGSVTGISIASLFTAGLMPALILAVALAVVTFFRTRGDALPATRLQWRSVGAAFVYALPALLLPFIIRWAVVEGVATATEVSTLGIAYAFVTGVVIYRPIEWRRLYPALVETASLSGAILFIIGSANAMAWALTQSGFSAQLVAMMAKVPGGAGGFLAVTVVVFVLLGNILEGIPAILLFAPLLLPVSHALHIPDVHYAIVVVIAMSIGLFAPPFGVGFYSACAIGRVQPDLAMGHMWRYLGALVVALAVIAAIPWFSTGML